MHNLLDPLAVPKLWRVALYDLVLLPWETQSFQCRTTVYSKQAIASTLGLYALKKNKLDDLQPLEEEMNRHSGEYLAFYCDGKGYETLFKRLRDSVAHAHYTEHRHGWITMAHRFQGRGEQVQKLRLIGNLKFKTLMRLVAFINVGGAA
jgi:hypothetical protein